MDVLLKLAPLMFFIISPYLQADSVVITENEALVVSATKSNQTLTLSLTPKKKDSIPLDPGITITTSNISKSNWMPKLPTKFAKSESYMNSEEIIELINSDISSAQSLILRHAYCPSEHICKFLDLEIEIPAIL